MMRYFSDACPRATPHRIITVNEILLSAVLRAFFVRHIFAPSAGSPKFAALLVEASEMGGSLAMVTTYGRFSGCGYYSFDITERPVWSSVKVH